MATSSPGNPNNSTNKENDPPPATRRRRSSIADILPPRSFESSSSSPPNSTGAKSAQPNGASMASAMAQQAQQSRNRRLSITTLGLSGGSPTRGSAFESLRERSQSGATGLSSRPSDGSERQRSQSYTSNESAIEEDGDGVGPMPNEDGSPGFPAGNGGASRPTSPGTQRKLSFGARAVSGGSNGAAGGSTDTANGSTGGNRTSPPLSAKREGFNWQESLRNRAQRSSISAGASTNPFMGFGSSTGSISGTSPNNNSNIHSRSKSVAVGTGGVPSNASGGEPPPPTPATPAAPAATGFAGNPAVSQHPKAPDHFQERILKGDFYMD
ncbi:MAG: hypothetical protein M1831_004825 [Alyxoria varia]|nr:MAG: hypothetical protein M1831_004825 [Alyxoria varia]